ncbi:MAG: hypothetical protein AB7Q16_05880 [Vicinamibacterales bacterium]
MWAEKLRGPDGMEGPFKRVYLDERNGEPTLFFVGAPHPTPGDADWWREVAQGLGVEIHRLKQEAEAITLRPVEPPPAPTDTEGM